MSGSADVVGGAGGLAVEYADLSTASRVLQSAALDVVGTALDVRRVLTEAGVLVSSMLDPGGFARAEAAVLAALLGPHGLVATGGRLEESSAALRAAVLRYVASDALGDAMRDVRHWAEGTAAGLALPLVLPALTSPVGALTVRWVAGGPGATFLADHPGVAEEVAGAAPSFFSLPLSLLGLPLSLEDESRLLSHAYPSGSAEVVARGVDTTAPPAPAGIGDLVFALEHRDSLAIGDAQGEIDVRRLRRTAPDGEVKTSWIVDVPGTKDWQFDPRHRDHLNDLATNLTTMAGDPSPRIDGLTRAMELAGVARDEPVLLVGHSQGGLVALRAAENYAQSGRFCVTHVVTAGSPTARMGVPSSVTLLALENRYDVVPQLDGQPPPDEANRITVTLDAQSHDVGRNHALSSAYLPGARASDDDLTNPSLTAWREGAAPFLASPGEHVAVQTTVWDIRNGG